MSGRPLRLAGGSSLLHVEVGEEIVVVLLLGELVVLKLLDPVAEAVDESLAAGGSSVDVVLRQLATA